MKTLIQKLLGLFKTNKLDFGQCSCGSKDVRVKDSYNWICNKCNKEFGTFI